MATKVLDNESAYWMAHKLEGCASNNKRKVVLSKSEALRIAATLRRLIAIRTDK
jgi:hypothetical protein